MIIKVLTPVSGNGFAFGPNQIVANVDPKVGEDLVKHGLAVEIDEDGKMVPSKADEQPVQGGNSPEETNKSEEDKKNLAETATGDGDGEASDDKQSEGETSEEKKAPAETATVKNAPTKKA